MLTNRRSVVCESLEARKLLAGDLAVSVVSSTMPASAVTNTVAKGKIVVDISNAGSTAYDKKTPKVDLQVLAVPVSGGTSVVIGQKKNYSLAKFAAGTVKRLTLSAATKKTFSAAEYKISVTVDPQNRLTETSTTSNNTASTSSNLTISAPFSRIAVDTFSYAFSSQQAGGTGLGSLVVKNTGNVAGKGVLNITIISNPEGSTSVSEQVTIGSQTNVKFSLKPNKTANIAKKIKLVLPANANVADTNFSVVAKISVVSSTPSDAGTDADRGKTSATRIALPAFTRTDSSPLLPGVGKSLMFTNVTVLPGGEDFPGFNTEYGDVTDVASGRKGTYDYIFIPATDTLEQSVLLTISFPAANELSPVAAKFNVTFPGSTVNSFKDKTLTFGVAANLATANASLGNTDSGVNFLVG